MKSVCVTKAKAYYIIADGYTECYTFNSREEAESFIELFKPYSNAVVKKIYCIVINGKIQEKLDFDSMEIAKDYIKLFSLKYRQENTIAIREIYRITTDIIIREVYQNVD